MYNYTDWLDHVTDPANCFTIEESGTTSDGKKTYIIARAGTVMQQGTPQNAEHFGNQESGIWDAYAAIGFLLNYARQNAWEIERGSVSLTNTQTYPFNNSQKTISLQTARASTDYIVLATATSVDGNLGQIEVSDKLQNGFKIKYTGSAASAAIDYIVIGGYLK